MAELDIAISKLKNTKSPGQDKIHPEFIKNLGAKTKLILLNIFDKVWTGQSNVATVWRKAILVPIKKPKNSENEVSSYRPISLTSVIAKTIERMLAGGLQYYLNR